MGISSIDDVLDNTGDETFKSILSKCKGEHQKLDKEIQSLLDKYNDDGKEPNPMAKGMSWIKTNVMLSMNDSDNTIADLMTDGCNMGIKSINRYINQYPKSLESIKNLCHDLSDLEENFAKDLREYL